MSRRMYRHSRRPASRVIQAESQTGKLLEQNRMRLVSILTGFAFMFVLLSVRLVEVSLVGGGELPFKRLVTEPQLMLKMEEQDAQENQDVTHMLHRREIVDRNGVVLATNIETASLVANPTLIRNPGFVAQQLAPILQDVSEKTLIDRLSRSDTKFVYLSRHLTPGEQERVNALGVPGLFFEQHDRRIYPFGALAAHVLGTVDVDNSGLTGAEKYFNRTLEHDLDDKGPMKLALDIRVQSVLQQELAKAMKEFSALGATGIVMDANNGEVIAMSSLPSFDPHDAGNADADARFNRATLGTYEMGSTFKTFTVAMALDNGTVGMRDGYDASQPIRAAGYTINDYHPNYRWLSVPEIYAYSSNIGTVKMALDVGVQKQRAFLRKLGMTQPVDIELPERAQPLVPADWREINAMTISYGHGMSVSPLHLVQGISAMVNGGMLYKPTLVKRAKDEVVPGERVIKEQTSQHVRELMRTVVQFGTAKKADVAGYQVGGKTGTAEKIVDGRYKDKAKLVSLVATFPTDKPRYVVYVMLDEPKGTKATYGYATGGWVAAPVVSNVIARMASVMGLPPHYEAPDPAEVQYWAQAEQRNRDARQRRFSSGNIHAASY